MNRGAVRTIGLLLATAILSCSGGDDRPAKDTPPPEPSPAGPTPPAPPPLPTWNRDAGLFFAIGANGGAARLVVPSFTIDQSLDSIVPPEASVIRSTLDLVSAGRVVGEAAIEAASLDSSCVGWPTVRLTSATPPPAWRVAFPAGRVEPVAFDSLAVLTGSDSMAVVTAAARAASRLPGDTATAFRGRPFVVRQANRFATATGRGILVEVVRQVTQEANPLQEQIVMILDADSGSLAYGVRRIGFEEQLASVELVAVVRVRATGRLALLLRREHDGGFTLQWYEQTGDAAWTLRWESALDNC